MDAGYSGTPQLKKLGIVAGVRFSVDGADETWRFAEEPDDAIRVADDAAADVVLAFVRERGHLLATIERHEGRIRPAGALWIAWPRKAGGHVSDLNDDDIRADALPRGLVDTKIAAIDADWSGLKLVWRRERRGGPT